LRDIALFWKPNLQNTKTMLTQKGDERGFGHDLKLAILLSAAAGSVNSASFFAFDILTTNVTGHVAVMANEMVAGNWASVNMKMIWMLSFFLGAFYCGFSLEIVGRRYPRFAHTIPILTESLILFAVAYYGGHYDYSREMTQLMAGSLLFSMGIQNAAVTLISGSVVRTTHLTGLITDVGLNLSQYLLYYRIPHPKLQRKIILHSLIILSFLIGGVAGAYLFAFYLFKAYSLALGILVLSLFYDMFFGGSGRIRSSSEDVSNQIGN
jgi:uncharacterized membrane protein YoaK (UPF0700 family)